MSNFYDEFQNDIQDEIKQNSQVQLRQDRFTGICLDGTPSVLTIMNNETVMKYELMCLISSYFFGRTNKALARRTHPQISWIVVDSLEEQQKLMAQKDSQYSLVIYQDENSWKYKTFYRKNIKNTGRLCSSCQHIKMGDFIQCLGIVGEMLSSPSDIAFIKAEYSKLSESVLIKKLLADIKEVFQCEANTNYGLVKKDKKFLAKIREVVNQIPLGSSDLRQFQSQLRQLASSFEEGDDDRDEQILHPLGILNQDRFYLEKWQQNNPNIFKAKNSSMKNQLKLQELETNPIWKKISPVHRQIILTYFQDGNIENLSQLRQEKAFRECLIWKRWILEQFIGFNQKKIVAQNSYYIKKGELQSVEQKKQNQSIKLPFMRQFPAQTKALGRMLQILSDFSDQPSNLKQFQTICQQLQLPLQKLQRYFCQPKKQKVSQNQENIKPSNQSSGDKLTKNNNPLKFQANKEGQGRKFEEITKMIEVYSPYSKMEKEGTSKTNQQSQLQQFCERSDLFFKQLKEEDDIRRWISEFKALKHLGDKQLTEMLGVLDFANHMATGGHRLRITQKIAIIMFLNRSREGGSIGQIQTGEGKTTIVSAIAAIKVLSGMKVDIITSNVVLAEEGAKEKAKFFNLLGITVSHNNPETSYEGGPRKCYSSDIVYGTITSFQFDYLRHQFERMKTFGGRKINESWVILDEVDSLIIDQGSNIAKLSGPFPGMESLRYVYLNIWREMGKTENKLLNDFQNIQRKQMQDCGRQIKDNGLSSSEANEQLLKMESQFQEGFYDKVQNEVVSREKEIIRYDLIAEHLHGYVERNFSKWIDLAMRAKYQYQQNKQYKIAIKDGEMEVIPVDNQNTGVSMKNTILSNGLHQFLQIKHSLCLTYQSLTSSYISNVAYIHKYGKKLIGLTGTLGSAAERDLLSTAYGVKFFSVPTYIEKEFYLYPGTVVPEEQHKMAVSYAALQQILGEKAKNGEILVSERAVLLICQTIYNAKALKEVIEGEAKKAQIRISVNLYTDESQASLTSKTVQPGDIIIATNISGRGTDFKISQQLETNGGMHVIVSFLPCNSRVEAQALGRTARQGKPGTGHIIISESDVAKMGIESSLVFEEVLAIRDEIEGKRLQEIKSNKLCQLKFKDQLFQRFCTLYAQLKDQHPNKIQWVYALLDLKERWAFWLEENPSLFLDGKGVEVEFDKFREKAKGILQGKIGHNIYYCVGLADKHLSDKKYKLALDELKRGLALTKNPGYYYPVFMKAFEAEMQNGNPVLQRYKKALAKIVFINVQKNQQYKDKALAHLEKALQGIVLEHQYLNAVLNVENQFKESMFSESSDLESNLLWKHLMGRCMALSIFIQNIKRLINELKGIELAENGKEQKGFSDGLYISTNIPRSLLKLDPRVKEQANLQSYISKRQVDEFEFIGMSGLPLLSRIHDVPNEVIVNAQLQIAGGLAALALCIPFPILLPVNGPIAGALIGEGITDIVMALVDQGASAFDRDDYIKSKIISYGISVITMGISAIMSSVKILNKALSLCRRLASKLRASTKLKSACNFLANKLDKIALYLEVAITKANILKEASKIVQFKKAGRFVQFLQLKSCLLQAQKMVSKTAFEKVRQIGFNIIKSSVKEIVQSVVVNKVLELTLFNLITHFEPFIRGKVRNYVQQYVKSHRQIFDYATDENIYSSLPTVRPADVGREIFGSIVNSAKENFNWKMSVFMLACDVGVDTYRLCAYTNNFCEELYIELKKHHHESVEIPKESLQQNINHIEAAITCTLIQKLKQLLSVVVVRGAKTFAKYRQEKKQQKIIEKQTQQIRERQNEIQKAHGADAKSCAHDQIGKMLGIDGKEVSDATGIATSTKGATIEEVYGLHVLLGVDNVQLVSLQSGQIKSKMQSKGSDRGVVCLKRKGGQMGHVEAVFLSGDGNLRVSHSQGELLKDFISRNGYDQNPQLVIGQNICAISIQDLKSQVCRKRIDLCSKRLYGCVGGGENEQTYGYTLKPVSPGVPNPQRKNQLVEKEVRFEEKDIDEMKQMIEKQKAQRIAQIDREIKDLEIKRDQQKNTKRAEYYATINKLKQRYQEKQKKQKLQYIPGRELNVKLKINVKDNQKGQYGKGSKHHGYPAAKIRNELCQFVLDPTISKQEKVQQLNTFFNSAHAVHLRAGFINPDKEIKKNGNQSNTLRMVSYILSADVQNLKYGPNSSVRALDPSQNVDYQLFRPQKRLDMKKGLEDSKNINIFNKMKMIHEANIHNGGKKWEKIKINQQQFNQIKNEKCQFLKVTNAHQKILKGLKPNNPSQTCQQKYVLKHEEKKQ